jgi:hypothetical protein
MRSHQSLSCIRNKLSVLNIVFLRNLGMTEEGKPGKNKLFPDILNETNP